MNIKRENARERDGNADFSGAIADIKVPNGTKSLKDFKPDESGIIKSLNAEGKIKRRLLDMGLTPGTAVIMKKAAPLGDPIEFIVRGYRLSLRKDEAATVIMEDILER